MYQINSYLKQADKMGADRLSVDYLDNGTIVLCLSDGAGGLFGSIKASTMAIDKCLLKIKQLTQYTPEKLEMMLKEIDNEIYKDARAGETTIVVMLIQNNMITGASVGDSQGWLLNAKFEYELTMLQRRKPLLGSNLSEPIGFETLETIDSIVLGSDGLFNYVNIEKIKKVVTSKNFMIKNLYRLAKEHTGYLQDDFSVIVLSKLSSSTVVCQECITTNDN